MNKRKLLAELKKQKVIGSRKNFGFPLPESSERLQGMLTLEDGRAVRDSLRRVLADSDSLEDFGRWLTGDAEVVPADDGGWTICRLTGIFASKAMANAALKLLQEWGLGFIPAGGPVLVSAEITDIEPDDKPPLPDSGEGDDGDDDPPAGGS